MMATLVVLASFISILLNKLRFPSLIGFLIAGIIIANYADISDDAYEIVEIFSTLGLIMLMFTIGMEIDVRTVSPSMSASWKSDGSISRNTCMRFPLIWWRRITIWWTTSSAS